MCSAGLYSSFTGIQALLRINILLSDSKGRSCPKGEPATLETGWVSLLVLGLNTRKVICLWI